MASVTWTGGWSWVGASGAWLVIAGLLLASCGDAEPGAGDKGDDGSAHSAGGSGSAGVAGDAGNSGSVPRSCEIGGAVFAPGSSFTAPDGCNTCRCFLQGGFQCTTIACGTPCGPAYPPCPEQEYCSFSEGSQCGGLAFCTARPTSCPAGGAPVCACDGSTYANACEAARAGEGFGKTGPCEEQPALVD